MIVINKHTEGDKFKHYSIEKSDKDCSSKFFFNGYVIDDCLVTTLLYGGIEVAVIYGSYSRAITDYFTTPESS